MKRIVGLSFVSVLLAACSNQKVQAQSPGPVPATTIGVNMGGLASWNGEHALANITTGDTLRVGIGGWPSPSPDTLDKQGWPLAPIKQPLELPLGSLPFATSTRIVCTWAGGGKVEAVGLKTVSNSGGRLTADWEAPILAGAWLQIPPQSTTVQNVDCRVEGADPHALFAPELIATVKPFKVLRFMDWERSNANVAGDWAKRTLPQDQSQSSDQGVALEHIIALVNQVKADPWLCIPYKADDDYVEHMAKYVHDNLHADGRVYVELGNEIWNTGFPATRQAQAEGLVEGLSSERGDAALDRYAEKAAHDLAIWTRIFADNPHRLIRVVSTQAVLPDSAETVLSFGDTAKWVDALATTAYFDAKMPDQLSPEALNSVFAQMDSSIEKTISYSRQNKAIAARFGKRYIAYEGGQSLMSPNVKLLTAVERDPRMGDAYRRFLAAWKSQIGDTLVLYNLTSGIGQYGAWGLQQYTGQPLSQTPKMKAVLDFLGEGAAPKP